MVKRLCWPFDIDAPFVFLMSLDTGYPDYLPYLNLVHEYSSAEQYLLGGGYLLSWCPTDAWEIAHGRLPMQTARLAALSYASQAQLVTDASPLTHFQLWQGVFCPGIPRWNILRGIRGEPLVPCYYWDVQLGTLPPGFE